MQAFSKRIRDRIRRILVRNDVQQASLFGSFAQGRPGRHSDVDILVQFRGQKSLLDLVGLKLELEETLRRNVDVLTYDAIHPSLREKILREQVAIL